MPPLVGRGFSFVLLVFVYLCVSPVALTMAKEDPCAAHSRCSECVFDASDGILSPVLDCAWCPTRQTCMSFNATMIPPSGEEGTGAPHSVCLDMRHLKYNPMCPDMSCGAAQTTNNIYICRPSAILTLVFVIALTIYNAFFYLWLYTVRQLPWKYEPWLSQLLAGCPEQEILELSQSDSTDIENARESFTRPDEKKKDKPLEYEDNAQYRLPTRVHSNCPICKMAQPLPLGPGHVCFWCDIARFGFMVFYIGASSSVLSFVLLFSVSLKPWFADVYFACIILSAYVAHAVFASYVFYYRKNNVHMEEARKTLYIELMIFLRGRLLLDVLPALRRKVHVPGDGGPAYSATASGAKNLCSVSPVEVSVCSSNTATGDLLGDTPKLTASDIIQKKGETAQVLSSNYLDEHLRNILRQTLGRDELILWCEKPDVSSIISHDVWLIVDFSVGVSLALWMIVSSTIKDTNYVLVRVVGPTSMGVIGAVLLLVFSCLLVMTLNSCTRLYVLTERRLLTIYSGLISPTVSDTSLQSVRFASVYGYKDWNSDPVLAFSWEVPMTERKLLPIKGHNFPGVVNLKEFLHYFNIVAPKLSRGLEQNREGMRHYRQVWRMHLFFCVLLLEFLPIVTLYPPLLPGILNLILFLLVGTINFTTIHRGLRVQHLTYTPLSLAGNWADAQEREGSGIGAYVSNSPTVPASRNRVGSVSLSSQRIPAVKRNDAE